MNISTGHYDSKLILLSITLHTRIPDTTLNLTVTPNENLLTSVKLGDINGVKSALDNGANVDIVDVDVSN